MSNDDLRRMHSFGVLRCPSTWSKVLTGADGFALRGPEAAHSKNKTTGVHVSPTRHQKEKKRGRQHLGVRTGFLLKARS